MTTSGAREQGPRVRPRGRPTTPGLTRDLVIRTAIAVADADGADALTMRRLADELGVHPTSFYNHVPSKDAIVEGVIDDLLADADLPRSVPDWATWVRQFAAAIRRTARAHPGAFGVFLNHAGTGPLATQHTEAALDAFRRAGATVEQAVRAVHGIALAVLGLALEEGQVPPPVAASDFDHLDPALHPRILEAEAAGIHGTDATWDLVVDALVAGLARTLSLPLRPPRARPDR
jgi:AcrR family transcriptional regulator